MSTMFYTGKRVLVPGETGFVGVHIVQQLLKQGAHVVVPVHRREFPRFDSADGVELHNADLFKMDNCLKGTRNINLMVSCSRWRRRSLGWAARTNGTDPEKSCSDRADPRGVVEKQCPGNPGVQQKHRLPRCAASGKGN